MQEQAEAAVAEHLTPEQYKQARDVQVGTVDDAIALVLNGTCVDTGPDEADEPAGDAPVDTEHAGSTPGANAARGDQPDGTRTLQVPELTDRENEIARLVLEGLGNNQIGDQLFISPRTVERHVRNIREKLGLGTRIKLAAYLATHLAEQRRSS